MTENKRFTFADWFKIVAIKDNGKIMNNEQVCEKLNDLYDENKELQERSDRQYQEYKKLEKENKELKKENQQLRELLEYGLEVSQVEIDEELRRIKNE